MNRLNLLFLSVFSLALAAAPYSAWACHKDEGESCTSADHFSLSVGAGGLFFEGDEPIESGQAYQVTLGYDINSRWGVELGIAGMPFLNGRSESSHLDGEPPVDDTWALQANIDAIYRLADRNEKIVPFLAVGGGGLTYYGDDIGNDRFATFGDIGGGVAYALNNRWSARVDYRTLIAASDFEINHKALFSLTYHFGRPDSDESAFIKGQQLCAIYFKFDSSELSEEAKSTLKEQAERLNGDKDEEIVLEGHCDERGTNSYNLALGERRANSAATFLRNLGVGEGQLKTISYGEERPADSAHNEAAWAKNRRVVCIKEE